MVLQSPGSRFRVKGLYHCDFVGFGWVGLGALAQPRWTCTSLHIGLADAETPQECSIQCSAPPMTLQSLMLRNVLGHAFGFRAYGLALGLRVEGVRLGFPTTPKAWKPVQEVQVGQSHIPEIKKYSLNHSFYIFKGRYIPELRDI